MKSVKVKFSIIIALALAFAAAVSAFLGLTFASADRSVTISGTSIFTVSNDAQVWAHEQEGEENEYYTMFVLNGEDDSIDYKKNLAYTWFANTATVTEDEEVSENVKSPATSGAEWFSMEIGFEALNFERFIITFESQQYYETKDGKTTNYLMFLPEEGKVKVVISDNENDSDPVSATALEGDHIKIAFTGRIRDEYSLTVSDGVNTVSGSFVNVGGTFSKSSSTSSSSVTPLSFRAKWSEDEEDTDSARMALYNLNGQSFLLKGATKKEGEDHYSGGTVNDDTPPVLCLNAGLSFLETFKKLPTTTDYTVIDVLATSPPVPTTGYFMLTKEQADPDTGIEEFDCTDETMFLTVKSDDDQRLIPHQYHYIPVAGEDYKSEIFNDNFEVTAAVKIYLKLTDSTSNGVSTYVFLDWYVDEDYLINVNGLNYIAVADDEEGVTFAYTKGGRSNPEDSDWMNAVAAYQREVTVNAQKLQAGSKNYFYLPSVEDLISDNVTKYSDLSFSIFYMANGSSSFTSATGKAASNLSIPVTQQGEYVFTFIATDAYSNSTFYYETDESGNTVIGDDGKPEIVKITSSNILTMYKDEDGEGLSAYLPWFRFEVGSATLEIEDPGERDTAYVGTSYSSISFDINGVNYDTKYSLYLFRSDLYYQSQGRAITYDEFMELKQALFENTALTDVDGNPINSNAWFKPIYSASEIDSEDEEEYEEFSDYAWNGSSFTPQDDNAFYLVICTATDKDNGKQTATAYMGISASPKVRPLKGEDTWVQDNLTSVILLCVAGASLIGIILLLVIKPRNKGDIDEGFTEAGKPLKRKK